MKRFTYLILLFVLLGCSGKVTKKLVIESDDDRFFKDTDLVINIDIDFVPPDSEILNDNDFTLDSDSYSDDNILKDNDLTTDIDAVTPDPTDLTGKANYYISFSKGNDDWSGTLPVPNEAGTDGPWKSLKMISSSKSGKYTVKAGEIVALQRGQTWFKPETNNDSEYKYAAISIHPSMTTNDKGITIGAYGSGANPIIDQGNELFALATVMVCISGGKNIVLQDLHLIAGGGNYPDAGVITLRGKKGPVENIRFERLKIDLSHNFIELSSGTGFGISIYGYENSVKDIYIVVMRLESSPKYRLLENVLFNTFSSTELSKNAAPTKILFFMATFFTTPITPLKYIEPNGRFLKLIKKFVLGAYRVLFAILLFVILLMISG